MVCKNPAETYSWKADVGLTVYVVLYPSNNISRVCMLYVCIYLTMSLCSSINEV